MFHYKKFTALKGSFLRMKIAYVTKIKKNVHM
jgi:hypothetical protein